MIPLWHGGGGSSMVALFNWLYCMMFKIDMQLSK